jgi:gamma-glutamyl:cysteine ligase YbdK (ATP-grasp superfamily)
VYNFQHSIQIINTAGGAHSIWIWFRKNGVDIDQSATEIRVQGNNTEQFAAWNFHVPMDVNDYVEIMWAVSDTAVRLLAVAASSPVPAVPSVILTVNYVGYEV